MEKNNRIIQIKEKQLLMNKFKRIIKDKKTFIFYNINLNINKLLYKKI